MQSIAPPMTTSFSSLLFFLLGLFLCPWIFAEEQKTDDLIEVLPVLGSEVVSPGGEVWVGLQISLVPNWHIYWKNAGEAGYPTTVQWTLPDGWNAGELQFPAPYLYAYEGMTGFALENNFTLLTRLKVPESFNSSERSAYTVNGSFNALVCNDASCLPYEKSFSLKFELVEETGSSLEDQEWLQIAKSKLPSSLPDHTIGHASYSGSSGSLSIHSPEFKNLTIEEFIFFPHDPSISVNLPAPGLSDKRLAAEITWKLVEGFEQTPQNLAGVLVHPGISNAWEVSFPIKQIDSVFSMNEPTMVRGEEVDHEFALLYLLLAVVLVAMAAWAYGRSRHPSALVTNWHALAIFSLLGALWLGYPGRTSTVSGSVQWETWSQELQDDLLQRGEAVYVDYTAKWCLSCQVNKRIYADLDLMDSMVEQKVRLLRADWTKKSPEILSSLQSHGREGVPFNLFYPHSENGEIVDPIILPEILSAKLVNDTIVKGREGVKYAREYDFLALVGLAWLGGLILNLMPCVFPVIGLKIMGFVRQAGEDRSSIIQHGWAFTLGVLLSFWLLVGVLLIMRDGLEAKLGWGFQLQEPVFVFVLALVLMIFGLSLSGVFEIGMSVTGIGSALSKKSGLWGSFFSGVLATVVATPCMAPFLGVAVGAALTMPPFSSFIIFTAVGMGLSTPYLGLSFFPQWVQKLPKPGGWMESFKEFMAFPIYATVAWLVWTLDGLL